MATKKSIKKNNDENKQAEVNQIWQDSQNVNRADLFCYVFGALTGEHREEVSEDFLQTIKNGIDFLKNNAVKK